MFTYFWGRERERERERTSGGGAEREKDRRSKAGSALSAPQPDAGLQLTNHKIMTQAEVRHLTD